MQYWDFVIKELDQNFIDDLSDDFNIDYNDCEITLDECLAHQLIRYIYHEAIDKIVDNIPEEILESMYNEALLFMTSEEVDNITYDDYKEETIEEIKQKLKDSIYLNYIDSSIDIGSEKLANEYSQELADYIFNSWLINY